MTWEIEKDSLCKEFTFQNFIEASRFIQKIIPLAEEINHHPDIFLHSYKKVKIILKTHSENKITEKDYQLAQKIDNLQK